jgi:hypothetical protein
VEGVPGWSTTVTFRGGLDFASGPDDWRISYCGRMSQTRDLLAATWDLHRAIRGAVDSEAFSDIHGEFPFMELRTHETIVMPWHASSGFAARTAAAMAQMQAGLAK